jgi:hypothetical protein
MNSDELLGCASRALLGEIYPGIRAIGLRVDQGMRVTLVYFLDHEPTDFDAESIETVATNLSAMTTESELNSIDVKCMLFSDKLSNLPVEYQFVYARREY